MRPSLSVVPTVPPAEHATDGHAPDEDDVAGALPLTVPVPRAGDTPWRRDGDVTWVPAALLLAAAGRCSCDDCCADLARSKARRQLACV